MDGVGLGSGFCLQHGINLLKKEVCHIKEVLSTSTHCQTIKTAE
jgi:hypothetical protein